MSINITNVLLLDNVDPSAKTILEENGIQATLSKEKFTPEALIKELQKYDGVVVRSATKMTSQIIDACPNLKVIGRAGTGVDNVDIKAATKQGVVVMNTPGGNTLSAAEHTCSLICSLARNIPAADASMKAGKWDRKLFMGHELYGKTLGIVGLGRIGREAALRMQSFGMKTIGFDPLVSKEEAAEYNIEWMGVEEIWPKADYITVHTPLIPQTKGLLNKASFAKCKKGVRVINCARGGIIDENDLLGALESGVCGGAGLDVFVEEPATNTALVQHPKVVACPHLGASTKEGQARCGREVAEQFVALKCGKSYVGVLNAPALSQASTGDVGSWITCISGMGQLMNAMLSSKPDELNLECYGTSFKKANACLKAAVYSGFLRPSNPTVNLINAASLGTAMGIEVNIANRNNSWKSFDTACALQAKTESGSFKLTGTVINGQGFLAAVNDCYFSNPVALKGNMLLYNAPTSQLSSMIGAVNSASVISLSASNVKNNCQWVAVNTANTVGKEALANCSVSSLYATQF